MEITVTGATVAGVARAKATALLFAPYGHRNVMFASDTSPANGLQAAMDLLGADVRFSHLKNGYPVYTTEQD